MVRPIGIQNTDLRYGRIAMLLLCVIILNMLKITEGHSQVKRIIKSL